MKKRNVLIVILLPVIITLSLYVVFNSRIECTPGDAGFWIVIALGMSLGVALTRISQLLKEKGTDKD